VYHRSPLKKIKLTESTSVSRHYYENTEASITQKITSAPSPKKKTHPIPALLEGDQSYHFDPHYVHKSDYLTPHWMITVGSDLKLSRSTIHMGIEYMDRFLSKSKGLAKKDLQEFGLCALLLSGKQNVILHPLSLGN
jgi:Cyclin, N-terminal domain